MSKEESVNYLLHRLLVEYEEAQRESLMRQKANAEEICDGIRA